MISYYLKCAMLVHTLYWCMSMYYHNNLRHICIRQRWSAVEQEEEATVAPGKRKQRPTKSQFLPFIRRLPHCRPYFTRIQMDAFVCQCFSPQKFDVTVLKQTPIVKEFLNRQPLLVVVGWMIYEMVEDVIQWSYSPLYDFQTIDLQIPYHKQLISG